MQIEDEAFSEGTTAEAGLIVVGSSNRGTTIEEPQRVPNHRSSP